MHYFLPVLVQLVFTMTYTNQSVNKDIRTDSEPCALGICGNCPVNPITNLFWCSQTTHFSLIVCKEG